MAHNLINLFVLVILVSSSLFVVNPVECFTVNYTTFNPSVTDQFIAPNGSSSLLSNIAIEVTQDRYDSIVNLSGMFLYKKRFTLWNRRRSASFNTTFVLNIQKRKDSGGEGLAFILAEDAELPNNSAGQWLGIVNATTNGSTSKRNIVAIEFDTKKSFPQDLDDNHVGLDVNSVYSLHQVSLNESGIRIDNGTDIKVRINYDGTTKVMNVSVKGVDQTDFVQIMNVAINLTEHLPSKVYLGFSASTGTGSENNCIKEWFFKGDEIDSSSKLLWVWIVVPTLTVVLVSCGALIYGLYLIEKRKLKPQEKDEDDFYVLETGLGPKKFKLKDLKGATGNFNPKNELGRGGFGIVYKGKLGGKEVAVKRIVNTRQGKQNLIAEVTTIGSLHHKNLVELLGWCYEKTELLLVYEYMPNGSLDKYIISSDEDGEDKVIILSWERRHSIICGVAQSLDYLHHECSQRVLHRDIKTSNIMLDSEFNARLGDFGLARMFKQSEQTHHTTKQLMGTLDYMAPEIFLMARSTAETDVFAFGVLVLVVVTGRAPGNQNDDSQQGSYNIVDWVWELHNSRMIFDAVDPKLAGEFDKEQAECMLILGLACCHPNPHMRPSMRNALQILMAEVLPPLVPLEKPVFMWPAISSMASLDHSEYTSERSTVLLSEEIAMTATSSDLRERQGHFNQIKSSIN